MKTKILIVDDHEIVRQGVRSLLVSQRPQWALAEAENGDRAREMVQTIHPDLIIMDITMPGLSGLEVVAELRKTEFAQPVLMFTMHKSEQLGNDAKTAGAQGYVLKSQAVDDLVRAIDALLAGGTFYGAPSVAETKKTKPNPGLTFFSGLEPSFA